jgi:hypothetical protein
MCSPPLPLPHFGAAVVFPFLGVLSGKLPYCHSVDWASVPVHGLCPRPNCEVPITLPPPGTAGGYTLFERRWRCVQHYLFSCKASPRGFPDPADLCADLWDLLPHEAPASARVWRFMWTPLMRTRVVCTVCLGSWILSLSCRAALAPGVRLCAPLLPPLFS